MQRIIGWLLIIAFALMAVHTLIYVAFGIALIPFPFDYDQGEGFELNSAVWIAAGRCPYCEHDAFPFYSIGYPPLFHVLMAPFAKLFGAQFWYGRLIIFSATFITAGAISWAVFRDSGHRLAALIAGLAFLSSNYIYHNGPLLRQHLLMVMFETLAVVVVAMAFDSSVTKKKRRLIIALVLLLCAGYTKQLAYVTCIAVALWMLLRAPRLAMRFAFWLSAIALAIFAFLMLATEGGWWTNIIAANQNPYSMEQFLGLLRQFLALHGGLLVLCALMLVYETYFDRISLYAIWFLAAFINTAAAGKWGAGDSYFATVLAAACILSGIFLARSVTGAWIMPVNYLSKALGRMPKRKRFMPDGIAIVSVLLFLAYGISVFKMPTSGPIFSTIASALNIRPLPSWRYPLYDPAGWTVGYSLTGHLPSRDDYDKGWEIIAEIEKSEGYLLSEDAGFNLRSGREVIGNAVILKNLWESGLYDPSALIRIIEAGQFGLVIIRAGLFPPPVMAAIHAHYVKARVVSMNGFDYQLWRPQGGTQN